MPNDATDNPQMPRFSPTRAAGRGPAWYRGDCHVHSVYSNGELTPEQLAAAARAAGLDFLATTEHNSAAAHGAWGPYAGDDLLVILGQEMTTQTGHWLALGLRPGQVIDWQYRVRDGVLDRHLDQVHDAGGLCVAAHPHVPYASGDFMYPFAGFDAVEVWNGLWASDLPWNAVNETAVAEWGRLLAVDLTQGAWRPAMGNSDTHLPDQLGVPQTVVWADELSTAAILAGIAAGRSWIAGSATVELTCAAAAGGHRAGIGERLTSDGQPVTVRVEVDGVPSGMVSFHTDRGTEHRAPLPAAGVGVVSWNTSAQHAMFVRVEVRQVGGAMAALTNPIILL